MREKIYKLTSSQIKKIIVLASKLSLRQERTWLFGLIQAMAYDRVDLNDDGEIYYWLRTEDYNPDKAADLAKKVEEEHKRLKSVKRYNVQLFSRKTLKSGEIRNKKKIIEIADSTIQELKSRRQSGIPGVQFIVSDSRIEFTVGYWNKELFLFEKSGELITKNIKEDPKILAREIVKLIQ